MGRGKVCKWTSQLIASLLLSRSPDVCDLSLPHYFLFFSFFFFIFLSPFPSLFSSSFPSHPLPLSHSHTRIFSSCVSVYLWRELFSEQPIPVFTSHISALVPTFCVCLYFHGLVLWGSGKAPVLDWTHQGLILAQPLTSLVALDKPSLRTSVSSENAGAMFEFPESGPETKTWGQVFTGEVTWGAEMQDVEGKPIKGVCFRVSAGDHRAQLCRRL